MTFDEHMKALPETHPNSGHLQTIGVVEFQEEWTADYLHPSGLSERERYNMPYFPTIGEAIKALYDRMLEDGHITEES